MSFGCGAVETTKKEEEEQAPVKTDKHQPEVIVISDSESESDGSDDEVFVGEKMPAHTDSGYHSNSSASKGELKGPSGKDDDEKSVKHEEGESSSKEKALGSTSPEGKSRSVSPKRKSIEHDSPIRPMKRRCSQ
ncbi:hypothetical protein M426DRAFT_9799 [Hypoxylon sp. CI-4A]|nr:hypothetical protein M426DRAFT_9799 [Hypoxylon sp. CI-4A]